MLTRDINVANLSVCPSVRPSVRYVPVSDQHLDKNELISESQHGFRKGYSCASNLLVFLETVTAELNAKHNVDTIYLDLAKAFDKVPHQRLMLKLKAHGIDGLVGNWIKSWLSDRWQSMSGWYIFELDKGWCGVPRDRF